MVQYQRLESCFGNASAMETPFNCQHVIVNFERLLETIGVDLLMVERVETRSNNARHVILKHGNYLYHVNKVDVEFSESTQMYNAVFRARRVGGEQKVDLDFEISQKLYEVLVDYTKLDDSDLLLVLQIDGKDVKWSFVSESWVRQQCESKTNQYIV